MRNITIMKGSWRRGWRRAVVAAACALAAPAAWCQIYAGSEASSGVIVLSNFKSDETSIVVVADPAAMTTAASAPRAPMTAGISRAVKPSDDLRRLIDSVARQTRLAPELIHAVIQAESRYDARALSNRGAIGLMQVMPATGKRFGALDLYSVDQNVAAGAAYLKWLMGQFDEDLELVLAAYNAGEQAVIKAGRKVPPFPETRAYVKSVMDNLRRTGVAAI